MDEQKPHLCKHWDVWTQRKVQ